MSSGLFVCLFVFSGRKSSRVSDISGEVVPDVKPEAGKRTKATRFAAEASDFEYVCV